MGCRVRGLAACFGVTLMRDPYGVLGVDKNANEAAIKSAYRRLAKKLHPDANKQDKNAASKFAELNAAYEILGDEGKRKAFDRGEIDAEGKPRFRGFEGFGGGPGAGTGGFGREGNFETFTWGSDGGFRRSGGGGAGGTDFGGIDEILKGMFGGAAGGRRPPFEPEDFGEAAAARDVTGTVTITLPEAAKGTSRRVGLPTGKEIDVKIPAGLADGQTIRLKGQGLPGPRGAGDALITVSIAPHQLFQRDGVDLRLDLPITLYEAVLGAKVRVPTLNGAIDLAIPAGTSSGRTLRIKGKGMPGKGEAGDLYVTARIVLPEHSDDELEEMMRRWRDNKSYDPRRDMS